MGYINIILRKTITGKLCSFVDRLSLVREHVFGLVVIEGVVDGFELVVRNRLVVIVMLKIVNAHICSLYLIV